MRNRVNRQRQCGFTMVELMAVLIIIGLLAAVAAKNIGNNIEQAKVTTTKANLKLLHDAVMEFYMDTGRYPTEEAGLTELVEEPADVEGWREGGYLQTEDLPRDGWKQEFIYEMYPESGKPFVIKSFGRDKEEGGEEGKPEEDLYSTDAN